MAGLKLSTENIIALTRLNKAVHSEYGVRLNISEPKSLYRLIKLSSESGNQNVQLGFYQFIGGLEKPQTDYLLKNGISFKIDEGNDSALEQSEQIIESLMKKTERQFQDPEPIASVSKKGAKKSQRIYRGQVVED